MNDEPKPGNKSPLIALILAFTPTVMVLGLMMIASALQMKYAPVPLVILMCAASIFCCATSSAMLFKRGTTFAMFGAILLLLLNGFISFGFGCCATLGGKPVL